MSNGKTWDLTSKHSLDAATEWIRKKSGALLVLVVRAEEMSFAVDQLIAPGDATQMVDYVLPDLKLQLAEERKAAKAKAEGTRCTCAQVMYRNNTDGTRDFKVKGESSCGICQGYGFVSKCATCDGCGLVKGTHCGDCCGVGVLADKTRRR